MIPAQTRRRTQVDRSAETRAVLIKATIALLQTVGFGGTTTALIAKQAGVTTGALHHHFATKDDLMFGVLDHASERVRARLEGEHLSPDGPLNMSDVVKHLWEVYGNPEYWAIWEIIIGTRSDPALHPRVVAHRLETMRTVLHPWLERHTSAEECRPDVIALFEFMLIAIRGLNLERFLDKDEAYFERNLKILAELVGQRLESLAQHDFIR